MTALHDWLSSYAATLERRVGEALRIHSAFRVCLDCGDIAEDCPTGHEVDIVCQECCTPGDVQSETCADRQGWHGHHGGDCWPCPTATALGVEVDGEPDPDEGHEPGWLEDAAAEEEDEDREP